MILSDKQRRAMGWWLPGQEGEHREVLLCDGAVRSGKTLALGIGFFLWAQCCFSGKRFGLCGKTAGAVRRNVLAEVMPWIEALGGRWEEKRGEGMVMLNMLGRKNSFYLFGGLHEGSAERIQGITFAGVLLDEAALMPRSFVEQAMARCSLPGSRIWMNCNPGPPRHWLYQEWILKAEEKNCLRLHFTMEDNPALTEAVRLRYQRLYSGVFYQRYVLGQWVQAEGRVYDFFTEEMVGQAPEGCGKWVISCDYGTVNPCSMGLWGEKEGVWYRVQEFYFDSRREGRQMTDGEYEKALRALAGQRKIRQVIVDPSAASFLELLRRKGWKVKKARNDVLAGIRETADALKSGRIVICDGCADCLRELEEYCWDLSSGQMDRVKKEHDHAMDDMRYFVTSLGKDGGALVWSVERS